MAKNSNDSPKHHTISASDARAALDEAQARLDAARATFAAGKADYAAVAAAQNDRDRAAAFVEGLATLAEEAARKAAETKRAELRAAAEEAREAFDPADAKAFAADVAKTFSTLSDLFARAERMAQARSAAQMKIIAAIHGEAMAPSDAPFPVRSNGFGGIVPADGFASGPQIRSLGREAAMAEIGPHKRAAALRMIAEHLG